MPELVALAVPGGPRFVDELRRAWDDGDAVFPLDLRLAPRRTERRSWRAMKPALARAMPTESAMHARRRRTRRAGRRPRRRHQRHDRRTPRASCSPTTPSRRRRARRALGSASTQVDDRWLACLPLAHVGGLSVVTRALVTGTPLEVHPGFDADRVAGGGGQRCDPGLARRHRAPPDRRAVVPVHRARRRRAARRPAGQRRHDLRPHRDRQRRGLRRLAARRGRGRGRRGRRRDPR